MKMTLENVRIAFAQLYEAKTVNGEGEPAFSASFLMAPDHPAVKKLEAAMEAVGKEKWGAKWSGVKAELTKKDRLAVHDGDLKSDYDGFPGNMFVSARNKIRPLVLDKDKSPLTEQDGRPYSGCRVHASIELWAQDNSYGKRINASLRGVQFYKDDERFGGGGVASADEFSTVEDAEEDIA